MTEPGKTTFIAMVQIETDDPRLTIDRLTTGVRTAEAAAEIRQAILEQIPGKITRLIAFMPEAQAKALMALHEIMLAEMKAPGFRRPPANYVAPKDQRKTPS